MTLLNNKAKSIKFYGLNENALEHAMSQGHKPGDGLSFLQKTPDVVYAAIQLNKDRMSRFKFDRIV